MDNYARAFTLRGEFRAFSLYLYIQLIHPILLVRYQ